MITKHIERKFLFEQDTEEFKKGEEAKNLKTFDRENLKDDKLLKEKKGQVVYIDSTENKTTKGFVEVLGGKPYVFPIPDPTLIYFSNAQRSLTQTKKIRNELLNCLSYEQIIEKIPLHELYNYYGQAWNFVINLFTALESFANSMIPSDYLYKKVTKRSTESFNAEQIYRTIDIKTKYTVILPQITGKSYFKTPSKINEQIWNLKELRDTIIHIKPENHSIEYQGLMTKSLKFKYDKSLEAVEKLINFYRPNYIVECPCKMSW